MLFYRQTGWGTGGMITPGILAMHLREPFNLALALLASLLVWLFLVLLVRFSGVYGRQRLAWAMFFALALRMLAQAWVGPTSLWLGWVVPGLMAADLEKFGFAPTFSGAVSTAIAAALASQFVMGILA
jgi:hypothetical protein